jgi:hypothetical protein
VVDDGARIVLAEADARRAEDGGRRGPGAVDVLGGQSGKLGDPAADVVAAWIEALSLPDWVEDPEVGLGVATAAG